MRIVLTIGVDVHDADDANTLSEAVYSGEAAQVLVSTFLNKRQGATVPLTAYSVKSEVKPERGRRLVAQEDTVELKRVETIKGEKPTQTETSKPNERRVGFGAVRKMKRT